MSKKDRAALFKKGGSMSMEETLVTTSVAPEEMAQLARPRQSTAPKSQEWQSSQISAIKGALQSEPSELELTEELSLAAGVYIATGATATGKTVAMAALAAWANALGHSAQYFSVFEPRSPVYPEIRDIVRERRLAAQLAPQQREGKALASVAQIESKRPAFSEAVSFLHDADTVIKTAPRGEPSLVIWDSVTDAIKAYAGLDERFKGQTTYPRGMQPSDRAFLIDATMQAKLKNAIYILILNRTLIPYADDLHGAVEGSISIKNVKSFSRTDRTEQSGRRARNISIPLPYVDATLQKLGLGAYDPKRVASGNRDFGGMAAS